MKGLLNGPPIILREQDRIGPFASYLDGLMGIVRFVDQGIKPLPGLGGRNGGHFRSVRNYAHKVKK